MDLRRINFSHGSECGCGDCTGGNANSYFEGMKQKPNIEQIVPIPGPSGKNNLLIGGITDSSGILSANGTDDAIDATAKSNLSGAGFNIETKPTTSNVTDTSDVSNNKIWTGLSRALINFIGLKVIPARVPSGGSTGQILSKVNGTDWNTVWVTNVSEIYNTVTITSYVYNLATITAGVPIPFTVSAGLAYKFKHIVAIVDPSNPANYIEGVVTSYSGTTLNVLIKNISGSGNTLNWNIMLSAPEYLPFVGDPANYGKFLYNNSGILEMRVSALSTGFTLPWHNPIVPDGFLSCDGSPFTQTEFPALFQHLRPGGSATRYAYGGAPDFTTPLAAGVARVPAYNIGTIPYGVDGTTILAGTRFGENSHTLAAFEMPVTSPYQLNDPGHIHNTSLDGGDPNSGAGYYVQSNDIAGGMLVTQSATTGITVKLNNIAGGQAANGGQPIDTRQSSEGCLYIIKT